MQLMMQLYCKLRPDSGHTRVLCRPRAVRCTHSILRDKRRLDKRAKNNAIPGTPFTRRRE